MNKTWLFVLLTLLLVPIVRADIAASLITPTAGGFAILSILLGVLEGLVVWSIVRSASLWKGWIWLPVLVLANVVSGVLGFAFSIGAEVVTYWLGVYPSAYRDGLNNLGAFAGYIIPAFIVTVAVEWGVLLLFRKKHGVANTLLLKALIITNAVSYAGIIPLILFSLS